ncbi:MAG TPA: dienelactone hydrolase family protein, partial [Candidatus Acidoferrales bacterium]|nr:dienelactone hydrolase family protein [Candidatus Acidoferrales bacterium]
PIEIRTPDGIADAFLITPEKDARWPGVLYLTDIFGIRETSRGMAGRLAAEGYTILLPNLFYRNGKPPIFNFPFKMGDERFMKRMNEIRAPLTPDAMDRDLAAYIDFLAKQSSVSGHALGAVGFCFSGQLALRAAAVRPGQIAAAASFHGGGLYTDAPTSPHTLLPRVKARLYFGHAIDDRSMPEEAIEKFDRALAVWGGKYESEIYQAHHGWSVPDNPAYNEPEAERAYKKLTTLFAQTLKAR